MYITFLSCIYKKKLLFSAKQHIRYFYYQKIPKISNCLYFLTKCGRYHVGTFAKMITNYIMSYDYLTNKGPGCYLRQVNIDTCL